MAASTGSRTFTVRFPDNLHQSLSSVAATRGMSMNTLMQEITNQYLAQEEEKALFDSYTQLGEDIDECSIEYAWEAQKEAIELAEKQN
jgi:plasmid stability protein